MQNFMLSSQITLLFCLGASGRRRKCLKIAKLYLCTFATSPLAALVCLTNSGRHQASQCSQWAGRNLAKIQFCHFQTLPTPSRSPKTTKKAIFRVSRSSLICGAQKTKITIFRFAALFVGVPNLLYTLPTLVKN